MQLYKIRSILWTGPMVALATAVMGSLSILASMVDGSGRASHRIAQWWAQMLLRICRVQVQVAGLERIAPEGSYVFVANHQSYMDVPVVLANISTQFRFMANKYLFKIPFLGHHLKRAGHLPVDHSNPRESLRMMSEAARVIREQGISILIFPEGARSYGELGEFKEGAAYVAIRAGVPVVPIRLEGLERILPRGSMFLKGGSVKMIVGEPISTVDYSLQERAALSRKMREAIIRLGGSSSDAVGDYEHSKGRRQAHAVG